MNPEIPPRILAVFSFTFFNIVVPGLLILFFLLAWHIVLLRIEDSKQNANIRKTLGMWLGLAGFVLVVSLHLSSNAFVPSSPVDIAQSPYKHVAIGISTGLVFIATIHSLMRTMVVALLVAILAFSSLTGLYFYIFIKQLAEPIALYVPSMLVGVIGYLMFAPDALKEIISGRRIRES